MKEFLINISLNIKPMNIHNMIHQHIIQNIRHHIYHKIIEEIINKQFTIHMLSLVLNLNQKEFYQNHLLNTNTHIKEIKMNMYIREILFSLFIREVKMNMFTRET